MSLQVWLPMTKDLKQQGLSDVTVVNNGATFNSSGKLGGCYAFPTTGGNLNIPSGAMSGFTAANGCSLAFWIKLNAWNTSYETYFQAGTGSTPWNNYIFGILRNGTASTVCFTIGNGSSASNANYLTSAWETGAWFHMVFTYETGKCKIYKNGTLDKEYNTSIVPDFSKITKITVGRCNNDSNYQTNCSMNDFRVYDHCLSPMEVKRISQGLVLHYPLNRMGFGQDNLMVNTHFDSRYTQSTGWNTTKNGTLLANSWGGYNSGVTNASSVYHAHLKEVNGEYVYEYIKTSNESWLGISQWSFESKLTAGKTYTFSWEEYHVEGTNRVGTGLYYYKTGATSANFHLGIQQASNVARVLGQWQKFSYTFVAPTDADWSKSMGWYIYGHYNGNGTFYMRHPKLEKGSIPTPWSPAPSDNLATQMGLNSNIEYDTSGYCNNGTRTGTFNWTSDTPKYEVSTKFSGSEKISVNSLPSEVQSVSFWVKVSTIPSGYGICYVDSGTQTSIGFYNGNSFITSCTVNANMVLLGITFKANEWNHIVLVKTGTNTRNVYCNGILLTSSGTNSWVHNGSNLSLGWRDYASGNAGWFNGQLCDFRAYATALSADDVKSLYQNSAYIDSSGNVYGTIHEV